MEYSASKVVDILNSLVEYDPLKFEIFTLKIIAHGESVLKHFDNEERWTYGLIGDVKAMLLSDPHVVNERVICISNFGFRIVYLRSNIVLISKKHFKLLLSLSDSKLTPVVMTL